MILRHAGSRRRLAAMMVLALLPPLSGCRFERRVPDGSVRDDTAVQAIANGFYPALARHDTTALAGMTFSAATILLAAGRSAPSLIAWRALNGIPERRTEPGGVRVVRTEVRLDGDFAAIRAVVAAKDGSEGEEFEASDVLTLARRDGAWRVAHILFGAWHPRTAP